MAQIFYRQSNGQFDKVSTPSTIPVPVSEGGTGCTSLTGSSGFLKRLHPDNGISAYFCTFGPGYVASGAISDIDLLKRIYPVGSVYLSFSNISPALLFGGAWSAITGRFLYCGDNTSTGGSNTNTHSHWTCWGTAGSEAEIYFCNGEQTGTRVINGSGYGTYVRNAVSKNLGARRETLTYDATISTMPAYQSVYAWRRTA